MPSNLELQFHEAMLGVYKRAKSEAHDNARIFIGMVVDKGGLETARYLMGTPPRARVSPFSALL